MYETKIQTTNTSAAYTAWLENTFVNLEEAIQLTIQKTGDMI